jgi:hypothetical protein
MIDIFHSDEVYHPYSKELVEEAVKILKREDIVRCLTDFIESSRLIDENYEVFRRIISERRLRLYLSYLEGRGFSTFSVDWQLLRRIEARPNAFLTVVVLPIDSPITIYEPTVGKAKLKYGMFQIADVPPRAMSLTYQDILAKIMEKKAIAISNDFVRMHSFTLSRSYAVRGTDKKDKPKEFLRHEINGEKFLLELRPIPVRLGNGKLTRDYYYLVERAGRVGETTYLLNPTYYNKVLGLQIDNR